MNQLEFVDCRGDIRMFIENTPIPNLRILNYESEEEAAEESEIISSFASNYRALIDFTLITENSSIPLLKIVEHCRA